MFFHRLVVCGLLALRNFSTLDRMVISLKVWWLVLFALIASWKAHAGSDKTNLYAKEILPLLQEYCYDCHGDGAKKESWPSISTRTRRRLREITNYGRRCGKTSTGEICLLLTWSSPETKKLTGS